MPSHFCRSPPWTGTSGIRRSGARFGRKAYHDQTVAISQEAQQQSKQIYVRRSNQNDYRGVPGCGQRRGRRGRLCVHESRGVETTTGVRHAGRGSLVRPRLDPALDDAGDGDKVRAGEGVGGRDAGHRDPSAARGLALRERGTVMLGTCGRGHRDRIDLTGRRFGRLVVLGYGVGDDFGRWRCVCDCGEERLVYGSPLRRGATRSCGCLARESARAKAKHGNSRRQAVTAEYKTWCGIIRRCENPNDVSFPRYGGAGVVICGEWRRSFASFLRDVGPKPSAEYSIDRWPDPDGHYEPGNCRWATESQQARNKRDTRYVMAFGERLVLADASDRYGIRIGTLWARLKRGWDVETALTTPMDYRRHPVHRMINGEVNQLTKEKQRDDTAT